MTKDMVIPRTCESFRDRSKEIVATKVGYIERQYENRTSQLFFDILKKNYLIRTSNNFAMKLNDMSKM